MKVKVGLETVVSVLPDTIVTAKDQAYLEPEIPEMLRGIFRFPNEVRRFRNNDAVEILAEEVAQKALDRAGLKPSDIDCIISNNCGGKLTIPMVGGYIHHKLGFPLETPVFNMQSACACFLDQCEVAWNCLLSGRYKRILIVAVQGIETSGGGGRIDLTDPFFGIGGDGAGAAIVSSQNLKCEFLSYFSRTFGENYDWAGCDIRRPLNPGLKGAPDQPEISSYTFGKPYFMEWWDGMAERFAIDGFNGALKKAHLTLSDIDTVIPHQPAPLLYERWMDGAEKAGVRRDKWKHTWDKYGNMSAAVIPVNLAEFWEAGEFKKDSIMAWIAIGAGGHAPTMIVRWLV